MSYTGILVEPVNANLYVIFVFFKLSLIQWTSQFVLDMSGKKPKFRYDSTKMEQAVKAVIEGMNPNKASKQFEVPRSTLRKILEGKSAVKPR